MGGFAGVNGCTNFLCEVSINIISRGTRVEEDGGILAINLALETDELFKGFLRGVRLELVEARGFFCGVGSHGGSAGFLVRAGTISGSFGAVVCTMTRFSA